MQVCEKIFKDILDFCLIWDVYSMNNWEIFKKSKIFSKNTLTKCRFFSNKWERCFQ